MIASVTWTAARLGGLAAWLLLGITVVLGVLTASRLLGGRVSRASLDRAHRRAGELTVAFLAVHLVALGFDTQVHFGPSDIAVPFASSWRPVAVAFGVVSAWLLVAVMVTSLLRDRMPRRLWHAVHMASYVAFVATSIHLMAAGTDAWLLPVQVLNVTMCAAVAALAALALARLARRAANQPVWPAGSGHRAARVDSPTRPRSRPTTAGVPVARHGSSFPRRIPRRPVADTPSGEHR